MRCRGSARVVSLFRPRDDGAARLQAAVLGLSDATALDIRSVRLVDASFDPAAFIASAASLFADVRAALSSGAVDPIAGRLSPELTAIIGKQLHYATSIGHQLTMCSIDKVTATLRGVEALSNGTIVCVVRYDVTGRMSQVMLTGDVPPASQLAATPQRTWYETWRLAQPAGVTSPPPATACPSCGAPASGETHCHYCHALLVDATTQFRVENIECMG
jgi:hypothetical protein